MILLITPLKLAVATVTPLVEEWGTTFGAVYSGSDLNIGATLLVNQIPMTADKVTPTHSFSGRGQASAASTHELPQCQRAGAHPTQSDPLASHLSDFLPQGDRLSGTNHPHTHTPSSPSAQVSRHRGFSTGG